MFLSACVMVAKPMKKKTTGIGVTIHVEIDDQRDSRRPARKRSQGSER
jgi:hypothetical protein